MKRIVLLMVMMMAVSGVMAQAPNIQWQKTYGGYNEEIAQSIKQTTDGGYIVAGYTNSNDGDVSGIHGVSGGPDFWVLKLNDTGAIQWKKCLGGTDGEVATSIQQTNDGGYIVAGSSRSNDGDVSGHNGTNFYSDYWVVKLNDTGSILWQKSYGGSESDYALSIQQTVDGGYVVSGVSNSVDGNVTGNHGGWDYWVIKLNDTGAIQWQKSLGGSNYDWTTSIQQTNDGGYILAGYSHSINGDVTTHHGDSTKSDCWIVKLNNAGSIEWQKSLGGSKDDGAYSIQQTNDGGYVIAGYTTSNDGDVTGHHDSLDYWVVKINSTGTIQWQKSLGGTNQDIAQSIHQTSEGGYIVAGSSSSNDGDISNHLGYNDYWIIKLNTNGALLWEKSYGGTLNDYPSSIQITNDSGYIIAGYTRSDDIDVTFNHGPSSDYWIVKLSKDITGINETPTSSITLSPNPTTGIITIKGITQPSVSVYNLMGQKVVATQGSHEVSLAQLPTGMYLVQVYSKDGELVKSEKVVKE